MQMIERVARAIDPQLWRAAETGKDFVESADRKWEGSWEQQTIEKKLMLSRERARAAIKAIREPTSAMVSAGLDCVPPFGDHNPDGAWRAMIDAALQESKEMEG